MVTTSPLVAADPLSTTTPGAMPDGPPPVDALSIPQSTEPPSMVPAFGEKPWDVQEREYQAANDEWFRKSLEKLDQAALDPGNFYKGKDLSFARNPDQATRLATNDAFLQLHADEPVPVDGLNRKLLRAELARKFFDGRGADDEDAFHAEIVKDATRRKSAREIHSNLFTDAITSATVNVADFWGDARSPVTFATWKEKAKSAPGYDPEREADYYQAWNESRALARESLATYQKPLADIWRAFQNDSGGEVGDLARDTYFKISDEDRPRFMASLKLLANTLPKDQQPTFWANLSKQSGRDIRSFGQTALDGLAAFTEGTMVANNPEESAYRASAQVNREKIDFAADVQRVQQATYDPMQYLAGDGSTLQVLEKGIYGIPGAVTSSVAAAVPIVGLPTFYFSAQESAYQELRQRFQDGGMSYADASFQASTLAPVAALPSVALERLQLAAFAGKLPVLEKVIGGLANRITSRVARFGVRTVAGAVEETAVEMTQNLLPAAVQEIGSALEQDIPGVQWSGKGGVLDGFWADSGSMFVTMLPLAIFGAAGGLSSDARVKAFSEASDTEILALGASPEAVAAIRAGLEKGNYSATQAIDEAMANLDPRSDTAMEAVQTLAEANQARVEAAKVAADTGIIPRFIRTAEGWSVVDAASGEEIGRAATAAGAAQLAATHTDAIDMADSDRVAYLATMLEAGDVIAAGNTVEGQTVTEFRPFEVMTTAQQAAISEADEARVHAQVMARERLNGGNGDVAWLVLGQSVTEFKAGVRQTVNRIQAGASILTVFHEETHGKFREALKKGTLTREGTIQFIRMVEAAFALKKTRDGEAIRFLPENDADVTDVALDEAVSELMEADILRTRKTGGKRGVSPALLNRNLSAVGKIVSGPSKAFGDFIKAMRGYFGVAFARAAAIKQALASGEIDAGEYDAFLSKLLGTTEQDWFDAEAAQAAGDILEGDPFSISRASFEGAEGTPLQEAEKFLRTLSGKELVTADGLKATISNNTAAKMTSWKAVQKSTSPTVHLAALARIEDLFGNGRVVESLPDKNGDPNIRTISRVIAPFQFEGRSLQAKFTVKELINPDQNRIYSIEAIETEDAAERKWTAAASENPGLTSAPQSAAQQVGNIDPATGQVSYSLSTSALAGALAGDALSRIKDPERRARAMSRMARTLETARLQAERLELLSGTKRMKRSLTKEAAMREAVRAEELTNEVYARHFQVLGDEDLVKLRAQPAHELLSKTRADGKVDTLRGRIMSKAEYLRRHPDLFSAPAEYDGMDGVSPTVFGGTLTPDQAAQELYSAGIIRETSTDAMWDVLRAEARSVATMRDTLEKAREELRAAKRQAKQETNDWLKTQTDTQATVYSPKQEILRTLAMLDGILSAVPADVRGRIGGYTQLAGLGTNESRLRFLKEKLAKADKELEGWLRVQFDKEFEALLKRATPNKNAAGEKPKGKVGADVHDLFRSIERAMSLSSVDVEAEAVALESRVASGEFTAAEEAHMTLEANLIRLAGDWTKADAARREAALVEAQRVFLNGYAAYQAEQTAKREARVKSREALQQATGKAGTRMERKVKELKDSGTKAGRALSTVLSLLSFEQVVHTAFGEGTPEGNALVDWERRASNAKEDQTQNKLDQLDELFASLAGSRYKSEELRWKLSQPGTIKVGDEAFSEMEAITATLLWRQEDGQRHMMGYLDNAGNPTGSWHYDQAFVDAIEAQLSDEAKVVRLHLGAQYATEYDRLNAVFRQLNGVNLPRHKFYSPLTVQPMTAGAGQIQDPVTGNTMSATGLTPGSLRTRSQTAVAEPKFKDALQVYIAHVKQMEHWIAYAPFAAEAMALLNNREVANSVEAKAGAEAVSVLRLWVDVFAQGGTRDAAAHLALNQTVNRMLSGMASAALVGRVSVLAVQSTQLGAALAEMPTGAYLLRLGKLLGGQLEWKAAFQSDYIQRRLEQMPPIVQQAMEGLRSSKPSRRKYAARQLGKLIGGADALFTAGTYAMIYDYHLDQAEKMNLPNPSEYAREAAERGTDRVAQPTRAGARSVYENASTNPAVRLAWSFASEARQKLALSAYALGNKPLPAKLRALSVTWLVGGVVATLIRAVMRDARDDQDDEWFDERNWDLKKLALSSFTGPFQGFPMLGDALEASIWGFSQERLNEGNMLSGTVRGIATIPKLADWAKGDREGVDNALRDAEAILTGVAPASEEAAAAAAFMHMARDLHSAYENFTGD